MALRPAPKRNSVNYDDVDKIQKEIFGSNKDARKPVSPNESEEGRREQVAVKAKTAAESSTRQLEMGKNNSAAKQPKQNRRAAAASTKSETNQSESSVDAALGAHLSDLETIAANIVSSKAGQGRCTTRPFSLPRTLIIDTTRLKSKFRTIDEQFTQNVIIDYLLREALAATTPENYKNLKTEAFEFVKRSDETTRRSLTVSEEVVYQMSELKAGINLETGKKYSNDEIFSTLLALGVSWLYQNNILS